MELRLDMLTLCRTCLQDGEAHMVSIYEEGDDKLRGGISLCEKIESLSGIQVGNVLLAEIFISKTES